MTTATLLIVEDDGILAAHLESIVSELGYGVLGPVATGEEAIDLLRERVADLVLMDIELAGELNGIETAEQIGRLTDVPIVFLTGFSHDPLLEQAKATAPYGYLIKPVPERELAATIALSLHRHRLDQQLRESQRALKISEAKYRHLFEHSPLGIFRSTLDGKLLLANEEMARTFGFDSTQEAVATLTNLGQQVYVDPGKRRQLVELLRQHGEVRNFEFQARQKNGTSFWLSMNARLSPGLDPTDDGEYIIDGFAMDITARKTAELALQESEQRHRTYLMGTPYGVFAADLEGRLIQVNPSACRLSGYEEQELLAMTIADLHFPENRVEGLRHFLATMQQERYEAEVEVRIKSGVSRWWSTTAVKVADQRILVFCNDITERKVAEKALRESETNFRTLFFSMHDLLVVAEMDGTLLACNDAVEQTLGYSTQELVAMHLLDLFPDELRLEAERAVIATPAHLATESRLPLQAKNGDLVPVVTRLWFGQWNGTNSLFVTCRNLSNEKEAEQRFEQLFRYSPVLMAVSSMDDGRFIDVNDIWLQTLGFAREEVVGKSPRELHLFPDIDKQQQAKDGLQKIGRIAGVELQVQGKDGSLFSGLFSGETIRSHGQVYFLTVMIDITQRKRIEAALEKRMLALLQPLNTVDGLAIEDLFNLDELQLFQDQFACATGVASLITRTDGTPITRPSNFTRLCRDIIRHSPIGRAYCERSDALVGQDCVHGPNVRHCLSAGLWDAGAAITIGGRHIGNWLIGQVRDASQTEDQMRAYAQTIGVDENALIEAFREVPTMSREQFSRIAEALFTLATRLSASAYQNVQQARFITERKRAEDALRASEHRYRELVEHANSIILRMDSEGTLSFFNEYAQRFFGFAAEEVLGKNVVGTILPETDSAGKNLRAMIADIGHYPDRYSTNENENMLRDGTRVWISWTNRPFFNEQGEVSEILCVGNDITQQKQDEAEKRHLQAQLNQAQKLEAIGTLAGGIAHDFNNILAAVIGYSEIAREEVADGTFLAKNIDQILKAGHRAKDLVKQILAFSRQSSTEATVFMPAIIIREAIKLLRPSLPTTITIEQHIDPKAGPICIDPTHYHQILMNLCTNAFHAMEGDGGTLTIGVGKVVLDAQALPATALGGPGEYVMLSVQDTGTGIPDTIRDRIFDPFFTTKEAGKGTGMGLSIIHGIVTDRGGFLTFDSVVGQGTEFRLYLPISAEKVGQEDVETVESSGGSGHILFVDDEAILVEMATNILQKLGYRVTARTSSSDALATFSVDPSIYDLVITDQTMPGMTGLELSRRLLTLRSDLPIILCTGYGALLTKKDVNKQGIRELVLKPLTKSELASVVKNVLDPT